MKYLDGFIFWLLSVTVLSCHTDRENTPHNALFTLLNASHTKITFQNQVEYTEEYNTYTYRNFYNGAGVGLGDFNNDGLTDIYFCGNLVDNKLYLNKGGFIFEDITEKAGVACSGVWSTGVSLADVNGDGWLDIYVCKSGIPGAANRRNELFINNGDLTFMEKAAEYGLADLGLSTHANFFDYDRDGDLDCYLLNNSFQSVTEYDIQPGQRAIRDTLGANKLYRNDGGFFTDVSEAAGIYGSKIGFGLGVSVGDVNRDGWLDLYVSNDFFEQDYLYINQGNGTFRECLTEQLRETSLGAMGADMADINNDSWPEIFVTEMTPEGNARLKTKALFEDWERYQMKLDRGYYHQFARNVLQLNNQDGTFSEIGRFSGVSTTDWSWGALIMDLDNDGWKDILVANGIYKDLLDRDYLDFYSDPSAMRSLIKSEERAILSIIDRIPSVRIPNYVFRNNHDLTFTNVSDQWGLAIPSFSNGAAYGDLDNDGDLDLVVNNVNMPAFVYRNESQTKPDAHYLGLTLKGEGENTAALGASVTLYHHGQLNYQELVPMRGFKSSVDHRLHFGLREVSLVDSLVVNWPDGRITILHEVAANQLLTLEQKDAVKQAVAISGRPPSTVFRQSAPPDGLDFTHQENDFVDFRRDALLFEMLSNEGPHLASADVNSDGLEDLFVCGARDQPGTLYVQDKQGNFRKTNIQLFENDKLSEDTDCAFFDAEGDGDQDLYVASGGNEFPMSSSALRDRLYINNGNGVFTKSKQMLPAGRYESTSCVQPADYDGDGDTDLFVGIRLRPFGYGLPVNGYLLENDGKGNFHNVSDKKAPGLKEIGMITDMVWTDVDRDGDADMVMVGDWMPVKVFLNDGDSFSDASGSYGLADTEGWWHTLLARDLNGDGYPDLILGNHGLNSRFKASATKPVTMYVNDFDLNGSIEQVICAFNGDTAYPVVMKDDLVRQIPSLANKYDNFADYHDQTITDIFSPEVLQRSVIRQAKSTESCVLINTGKGSFHRIPLPAEAQFSPVYALYADDFTRDGIMDILLGGNQYRAKPETGIYAASYGLLLRGTAEGAWQTVSSAVSGIRINGEVRDIKVMNIKGDPIIVIARNNNNFQLYKF